jgi:hypothetical protein
MTEPPRLLPDNEPPTPPQGTAAEADTGLIGLVMLA